MTDRPTTLDEAILAFPIDQKVAYMPVKGQPFAETTVVRSLPWLLSSGHVVLKVEGRAGGVSVE